MAFKIKYKFNGDMKYSSCIVTYSQYKNFHQLPIVEECEVIKGNEKNIEEYRKEMQRALDMASQESLRTHVGKLSENL